MKTVFDEFPKAVEAGWRFGQVSRGTEVGDIVEDASRFAPIVSDGNKASFRHGATADAVVYDLLLYVRPSEMPTRTLAELMASYVVIDPEGRCYDIIDSGVGKNQNTGEVEHFELMLSIMATEMEVSNNVFVD